jgi:hypothetical protein
MTGDAIKIDELNSDLEEADLRLIPYKFRGASRSQE